MGDIYDDIVKAPPVCNEIISLSLNINRAVCEYEVDETKDHTEAFAILTDK